MDCAFHSRRTQTGAKALNRCDAVEQTNAESPPPALIPDATAAHRRNGGMVRRDCHRLSVFIARHYNMIPACRSPQADKPLYRSQFMDGPWSGSSCFCCLASISDYIEGNTGSRSAPTMVRTGNRGKRTDLCGEFHGLMHRWPSHRGAGSPLLLLPPSTPQRCRRRLVLGLQLLAVPVEMNTN